MADGKIVSLTQLYEAQQLSIELERFLLLAAYVMRTWHGNGVVRIGDSLTIYGGTS